MVNRDKLSASSASGLWITLDVDPARIFVTRGLGQVHAVLLDDWNGRDAFSLIDLDNAPNAEFAGEALIMPVCVDADVNHSDEGRMIIRDGQCYLTCLDADDEIIEILVDERPPELPDEEGDLGNAWDLHFRYYHEFFAVGFECFYPRSLKVDYEAAQTLNTEGL